MSSALGRERKKPSRFTYESNPGVRAKSKSKAEAAAPNRSKAAAAEVATEPAPHSRAKKRKREKVAQRYSVAESAVLEFNHVTCDLCVDPAKKHRDIFAAFFRLDGTCTLDVCSDCFQTNGEVGEMVKRGTCKRAHRLKDGNVVEEDVPLPKKPRAASSKRQATGKQPGRGAGRPWKAAATEAVPPAASTAPPAGALLPSPCNQPASLFHRAPHRRAIRFSKRGDSTAEARTAGRW